MADASGIIVSTNVDIITAACRSGKSLESYHILSICISAAIYVWGQFTTVQTVNIISIPVKACIFAVWPSPCYALKYHLPVFKVTFGILFLTL